MKTSKASQHEAKTQAEKLELIREYLAQKELITASDLRVIKSYLEGNA